MYSAVVQRLRNTFSSERTLPIEFRLEQLMNLHKLLDENSDALCDALYKDLRKAKLESLVTEVDYVKNDIINTVNHLAEWMAPEKVKKQFVFMMDTAFIKREPLGVVLIIGAWNFPIQVLLLPFVGALAAGNVAVLKPSEMAHATEQILAELIPRYLDQDCYQMVTGGVPETTELLKERFDYILYTGNTMVGKIVMTAASKYLTPCTLELGGKNPVYVDGTCNMEITARRLTWGKLMNNGQICLSPDYILCNKEVQERLIEEIKKSITEFYGENIKESVDYGRIISSRHVERLEQLLSSGSICYGGEIDKDQRFVSPTILVDVKEDDVIMKEEVFGPILPFITIKDANEAITFINSREKPLALYVFSKDKKVVEQFLQRTSSGSFAANEVLLQSSVENMPFGGVGHSGFGAYHGKFSFDTFSHKKSCLLKAQNLEKLLSSRYPPYNDQKLKLNRFFLNKSFKRRFGLFCIMPIFVVGLIFVSLMKYADLDQSLI